MSFRAALLLALSIKLTGCSATPTPSDLESTHGVGNPGNALDLMFILSCGRGAHLLERVPWDEATIADSDVRDFLKENHRWLAAQLANCDLRFTDGPKPVDVEGVEPSCARTNVDPSVYPAGEGSVDTVFISRKTCSDQGVREDTAVITLIHEMIHHFVDPTRSQRPDGRIDDESFCNRAAAAAHAAWQELLARAPKKWLPKPGLIDAPAQRAQHTAVWTGATGDPDTENKMLIWGGCSPSETSLFGCGRYFRSGAAYRLADNSWQALRELGAPDERTMHTAVWTGANAGALANRMLVWGGCNGGDVCFNSLASGGIYDPKANRWAPLPNGGAAPSARVFHTAVWAGDRMLIWGGESAYQSSTPATTPRALDDGAAYQDEGWTEIPTTGAPSARGRHTAVWTGKQMIVWGGCDRRGIRGDGCNDLKGDGMRFDPTTNEWLPLASDRHTPKARYGHTAVWTGRYMIVWGGISRDGPENSGGIYDPEADRWLEMNYLGPTARTRHTAVWTGRKMLVWGGTSGGNQPPTDLGEFSPPLRPELGDVGDWTVERLDSHPDVAIDATAVWTGDGMIVWGGSKPDDRFIDRGGLYVTPY